MPIYQPSILPNIYTAFRKVPQKSWMNIVKLYEENRKDIALLTPHKRLDVLHMYVEALHELEAASKVEEEVTDLIYLSLSEEIPPSEGRLFYEDALYWKACAALHLMKYKESQHILRELVNMRPSETRYSKRLCSCFFKNKPLYVQRVKAFSVVLFILAALVVIIEMLVIDTFYPKWSLSVEWVRSSLFVLALLGVALAESYNWLYSKWRVKCLVSKKLSQKN